MVRERIQNAEEKMAGSGDVVKQPAGSSSTPRWLWISVCLFAVALLLLFAQRHIRFDVQSFGRQLRLISPLNLLLGIVAIQFSVALRAPRWSILLAPVRKIHPAALLPSQWIGFAAVAAFGRLADLARPYMVARRSGTPVATQLAIYSIERAFDLAAAAILFSVTLAFAPRNMAHHEAFARAGLASLAGTALLVSLAVAVRFAGEKLAKTVEGLLHPKFPSFATSLAAHILEARRGFGTLVSLGQFSKAMGLSLIIWLGIALGFLESARCFRSSPELATMSFAGIMLLLATSLGASLLQLPVVGWFTQIAVLAAAYRAFYGVPLETASACSTVTLFVTLLSLIPLGIIVARIQGISLREAGRPQG